MSLPWQRSFCHCRKMSLANLHPKANICANSHEKYLKTEEVVRDARFPSIFCHNMPSPRQRTFCHRRKMCLAHLHPKATYICAKFPENCSKTDEVARDARFATDGPNDRPTNQRPTDATLIPIIPLMDCHI